MSLDEKYGKVGTRSGYVWEELGELYLLKNEVEKATDYFASAYKELIRNKWLVRDQPKRLERLKRLGKIEE